MRSALYACTAAHRRYAPKGYRFAHRIFMIAVDLDEWEAVGRRCRLLSTDARNLYALRDDDFFPTGEPVRRPVSPEGNPAAGARLKARVLTWLRARDIAAPADARVTLLAMPRTAGYLFNPVSFYFVETAQGEPVAALAEVTNTYREVKLYALGPGCLDPAGGAEPRSFRLRCPKDFYVSPFSPPDGEFVFTLTPPAALCRQRVDHYAVGLRTLTAPLTGVRHELTDTRLLRETLVCPLVTLRTMALIHLHALSLWLRRLPWWAKAASPERQTDVRRPV
jgi:DUF1365 family protein